MTSRRSIVRRLLQGLKALVNRSSNDRDLDDELGHYVEMATTDLVNVGTPPGEATRVARRALGSAAAIKDHTRDVGWEHQLEQVWLDAKLAVRTLRRSPGFATVSILTLAIGIGSNTAIFTLLEAVLFKPLPVPQPGELVTLYETSPEAAPDLTGGTGRWLRFSYPRFEALTEAVDGLGSLAATTSPSTFAARLPGNVGADRVRGELTSGNYFDVLQLQASRGRLLRADDATNAAAPVAVISDNFFRGALGGASNMVGGTLTVHGVALTIVGVAPPGFVGIFQTDETDFWAPLSLQFSLDYRNNSSTFSAKPREPWLPQDRIAWLNVFGRVPAAGRVQATGRLAARNRQESLELGASLGNHMFERVTLGIEPLAAGFSGLRASYTTILYVLTAIVMILLLIVCANIANLSLVRAVSREREVMIRRSIGAPTRRLVQQLLIEGLVIAGIGGGAGLLLGSWGSTWLAHRALATTAALPPVFSLDWRVLTFTASVSIATTILCGLAPAIRVVATGRREAIGITPRTTTNARAMRGMQSLVVIQVALSVAVVAAAGLLGRTLVNYGRIDPGFEVEGLVAVTLDPSEAPASFSAGEVSRQVLEQASKVPGVISASTTVCGLIENCSYTTNAQVDGLERPFDIRRNWIGPEYFKTAGSPIVLGREFDSRDTATSPRVAIVTESIVRRDFGGTSPLGRRIRVSDEPEAEIVGVVLDIRAMSIREAPVPSVFLPIAQPATTVRLAVRRLEVRVARPTGATIAALRQAVLQSVPGLRVTAATTVQSRITDTLNRERLLAALASSFAVVCLAVATVGLYGVLSYLVTSRSREIGVRSALGATRVQVLALVLRQGAVLATVGIVAGAAISGLVTRYLASLLFGVDPTDPLTLAASALLFAVVAALASYLPARRATRIDPLIVLRSE